MKTLPHLVFRGTLLMCFLMVLTCLALTRGSTLASSKASNKPFSGKDQANSTDTLKQAGLYECKLSEHYPGSILQWCDLITRYANQHNLPPNLIAALIWQESGGNPSAYSASGAVGLMQVMPRDGLAADFMCANGPCFSSRPAMAELQDPEFNVQYGTRMLAGLVARTQDMREALKRYGPHDVGYSYADKVLGIYAQYSSD